MIFTAVVKYTDVREIGIEAETIEEAEAKYASGDFSYENTINFYSEEEVSALRLAKEEGKND